MAKLSFGRRKTRCRVDKPLGGDDVFNNAFSGADEKESIERIISK
jgi:hypothetical protein